MIKGISSFLAMLCLCLSMTMKAGAQSDATTVIIMRHAEKQSGKNADPDLSAAGKQRALHLATLLEQVQPTHLLATSYKRTRQTLEVLAEKKGVPIETYDAAKPSDLIQKIRDGHGETFIIAGHANTAPELVNALLGEQKYNTLGEAEFGKIWILTLQAGQVVSCVFLNTN